MTGLDKPHECLRNPFSLKSPRTATTANETAEHMYDMCTWSICIFKYDIGSAKYVQLLFLCIVNFKDHKGVDKYEH